MAASSVLHWSLSFVISLQLIRWVAMRLTPTVSSVPCVGLHRRTWQLRSHFNQEVIFYLLPLCSEPDQSIYQAFPPRTDAEHRSLQEQFQALDSKGAREKFVKEYATRFSEFTRLPYFDFPRMIIIDPMHNFFLGQFHCNLRGHIYI